MEMNNIAFTPIGKVMIEFLYLDNLLAVPKDSFLSIRVSHSPFSIDLKNKLYHDTKNTKKPRWN